jgi:RimJ/RimL family protein N-acetyltransferase
MARMPLTTSTLTTPTLTTALLRLRLRPFVDDDLDAIVALHGDARVLRYWDSPPWTERAQGEKFLRTCREMVDVGAGVRLAVDLVADGQFLGWCTLHRWNPTFRSASLGYCYTEASWGHGYATEAASALLSWGYTSLDLNRVHAEVDTRNRASARVLEKLGFVHEGTQREDCIVDGVVSDTWVYGLLRRDRVG